METLVRMKMYEQIHEQVNDQMNYEQLNDGWLGM